VSEYSRVERRTESTGEKRNLVGEESEEGGVTGVED